MAIPGTAQDVERFCKALGKTIAECAIALLLTNAVLLAEPFNADSNVGHV
jgi:hypothetical protein